MTMSSAVPAPRLLQHDLDGPQGSSRPNWDQRIRNRGDTPSCGAQGRLEASRFVRQGKKDRCVTRERTDRDEQGLWLHLLRRV